MRLLFFRGRGYAAFHGEFRCPQKYIQQMASAHRINVGAFLQETCRLHNAFTNEGVVRLGGRTARVQAPRNAAQPQPLETTGDEVVETKRLKFQDANSTN